MEQEFRTTFIPKKPVVATPASSTGPVSRPVGILFVVSLLLFVATGVIAGGTYVYKSILTKDVADLQVSLEKVQQDIETNVIKEFTIMDKRLKNAQTLVSQHMVIGPLFDILRTTTLPSVRYTKMDVSFNDSKNLVANLSGESDSYRSIALQSQALADYTDIKDMIFSNFVVTPKGRVSFDLSFTIPSADLSFSKIVQQSDSDNQDFATGAIPSDPDDLQNIPVIDSSEDIPSSNPTQVQ